MLIMYYILFRIEIEIKLIEIARGDLYSAFMQNNIILCGDLQ